MPVPTPFHERTSRLCTSLLWKDWAGYYAVRSYDTYMEREYFALRHAAGLIDVTPLFKYEVRGADAARFLSQIMVRNIAKLKPGRVMYTCWCDDEGKVVDDGTVARIGDDHFRVTSADPSYGWFMRFTPGYDVAVDDSTAKIGALSLQGPNSRAILNELCREPLDDLAYFAVTKAQLAGVDVYVSRTGYTGDLGYEVWVVNDDAIRVYDALLNEGKRFGLEPAGLDAMDITRIEAGYILNGVDYYNANHCLIPSRKSSPYELDLGWMVRLKRPRFNGSEALAREKKSGSPRKLVALDLDWDELEAHFKKEGLPPQVPSAAWREPVPVYNDAGEQIGYATSGAWSPTLKKNIALATVKASYGAVGTTLQFEVTVEYKRLTVTATVVKKPLFDPERKRG